VSLLAVFAKYPAGHHRHAVNPDWHAFGGVLFHTDDPTIDASMSRLARLAKYHGAEVRMRHAKPTDGQVQRFYDIESDPAIADFVRTRRLRGPGWAANQALLRARRRWTDLKAQGLVDDDRNFDEYYNHELAGGTR